MAKRIISEFSELNEVESFLLSLCDERCAASVLNITRETLDYWVKLGLPVIKIGNKRYFSFARIDLWLDEAHSEFKSNRDMLWKKTPPHQFPQIVEIDKDLPRFEGGKYWAVPVDPQLIAWGKRQAHKEAKAASGAKNKKRTK